MTARACSLLFACVLASSLTHAADDAAVGVRRPVGIGHLPLAPGQRLRATGDQPAQTAHEPDRAPPVGYAYGD